MATDRAPGSQGPNGGNGHPSEPSDKTAALEAALAEAQDELKRLAFKDALTGLYNHRAFQERLREEVARARRYRKAVTLLFADIDHFKAYNQKFGHPKGDQLLKSVGDLILSQARGSDVCAR